ncbi:UBX domain-containing protein 6 [Paragonimus westermani]|uniref:UBX domain-containing protein 6 n=1 Tax=Paragonimus westermani TaxID=34504 RepID=A0A5J4NUU2_9TREM|nr:UBX domain-containing protein 6 [Paragonimus westermani]
MSKILEFFKTKKLEKKFSRLGEGHRLGEASSCDVVVHRSLPESPSGAPTRQPPSGYCESAAKAAEAAMERLHQRNKKPVKSVNQEVKREREELHRAQREAEDLKERLTQKVIVTEKPSALSQVLFWCPALFGDAVVGTRDQIEQSINEYLSSEAKTNFSEAATLMLVRGLENYRPPTSPDIPLAEQPTPSEWREKRRQNFARILNNLIQYPDNPVYRKLRVGNQLVRDLLSIDGAKQFFQACRFTERALEAPMPTTSSGEPPEACSPSDTEPFLVISEEDSRETTHLQRMLELLNSAEPIMPELYRETKVLWVDSRFLLCVGLFFPRSFCCSLRLLVVLSITTISLSVLHQASGNAPPMLSRDQLPEEYFYMTKDEVKRSLERQQRVIEESGMLLTKAMRERLKVQEIRLFRYALIRVRLPGDLIIQGTFYANDTLGKVREWITDCLAVPSMEYQLWAPPGTVQSGKSNQPLTVRTELTNEAATLIDLSLAPCGLITLSVPNAQGSTDQAQNLLRSDLLKNVNPI